MISERVRVYIPTVIKAHRMSANQSLVHDRLLDPAHTEVSKLPRYYLGSTGWVIGECSTRPHATSFGFTPGADPQPQKSKLGLVQGKHSGSWTHPNESASQYLR